MPLEHALQRRGLFPSPGPWKQPKAVPAVLTQPLGMDMLPRQKHIKTKRKPYQLNVMVVGESGLGKSTFVNTLFYADLKDTLPKVPQDTKTVDITPVHFELEEDGVKLHLCLIDTPGFGDRLNRDQDVHPILEYIDQQYEAFYEAEKHVGFRRIIKDTRVHACLYFISPTGHSMKELDIKTLQELSSKVTVIPVIAKADTMTADEKKEFKKALLEDLALHEIPIYPNAYPDEHREPMDDTLQHVPFAVMGSNEDVQLPDGKTVRGRAYRWGTVEVENPQHCDMAHLRQLLMIECLHELGDIAHHHHYHDYRLRLLQAQGREDILMKCDEDFDAHIEGMTKNLAKEMSEREENMRKQFVDMVQNTEDDLKQREQELQRKREAMMKELEEQQRQIAQLEQDLNDKLKLRSAAK
ncbi:cell division control gtp binding protein [Lichtheimia corymbifera JMRC:FSU:9682]|uniref:Cell division control gtp binding protein n=1 Tax=Lichtheimia corymbifera JMRC:FSU:9682 TaxID=1263082 RepID=A0A068S8R2_9FUNG|nr:cell division control gtp binding protein [Lichtheimia corymbifera JMRC:FSU:9682]